MIDDPTKTLTIRRRVSREIDRRFGEIKRVVRKTLKEASGLIANAEPIQDGRFVFVRETEKVAIFDAWLKEQIDAEILAGSEGEISKHWLSRGIVEGYNRGATKTRMAAEKAIPSLNKLDNYSPLANPSHIERAELLYTRAFQDLKGVTEAMATQMSRVLAEGIIQGEAVKVVAKKLEDRVDAIGRTRAKLIARTEIVESHNSAAIREGQIIAAETGIEEKYQWNTAMDGRERQSHASRHGEIYTASEVQSLIGEPNCRCSVAIWFDVDEVLARRSRS